MKVDYVYAAEGQPYITYVTVEGDQVKHLREAIWRKAGKKLEKYGVLEDSDLSLWKEGGEKSLELDRVLTGGVDPVFKDGEEMKVSVTPVGAATGDAPFVGAASPAKPAPGVSKTVEELREELVKPEFSCFVESSLMRIAVSRQAGIVLS